MRKCIIAFSLCVLIAACSKEQNEENAEIADSNTVAGYTEEVDWEW